MVGFNSHEGCFFVGPVASVEGEPDNFTPNRTFYENTLVPRALEIAFDMKPSKQLRDLILQVYTNWDNPNDALLMRENFVNLYTDIIFAETIIDYVKNHHRLSSVNKTYLYAFDVLRNVDFFSSPSCCTRGTHGDELHFEFFEEANGLTNFIHGFEDYVSEDWERDLAKVIMTLWTNFAKTGNPNEPEPVPIYCPPYTDANEDYLHIIRDLTVKSYLIADRYNMWRKLIPFSLPTKRDSARPRYKADSQRYKAESKGKGKKEGKAGPPHKSWYGYIPLLALLAYMK